MPAKSNIVLQSLSIAALFTAVFAGGCGEGTVSVSGRVTYNGGSWPKPGVIHFLPEEPDPDYPSRPGSGQFDTDGQFTVSTYKPGDGLFPGTYSIAVECWLEPPSLEKSSAGRSAAPPKYQSGRTSDLKVTIEPDKPRRDLELNIPRP